MNKAKYNKCVTEAKKVVALLRLKNKHRIRVAEIAMVACKLKHGGRIEITRNTVGDFAEKIGVNKNTLYEWIRYKRKIYDNLTREQKACYNEVSADSIKIMMKEFTQSKSKEELQRKFDKFIKTSPIESKLIKYSKVMDTIIYNLETYDKASEIPEHILKEFIKKSRTILQLSEKTLEFLSDGEKPKREKIDIDWENFWAEEVEL